MRSDPKKWVNREELVRNVRSVKAHMEELDFTPEQLWEELDVDLSAVLGLDGAE